MKSILDMLNNAMIPFRERSERRPAPEFIFYFSDGSTHKSSNIRDISSTGVFLFTGERWLPGNHVQLTLQRKGPFEEDPKHRVSFKARVVRWGEDGVGFSFELPKDIDFDLWRAVLKSAAEQPPSTDILPPFRMAKALDFLTRLCPGATQEMNRLMHVGLGNMRVSNAVQIALSAEHILASEPNGYKMRANPQTVLRIIADGSWADEDWIQVAWAGLLAMSSAAEEKNQLDTDLADRFSQLAPVHVKIFEAACTKAKKFETDNWEVAARPLICSIEEIQQIAGVQSLAKIERDVFHLADLGLLEQSVRSRSLQPLEEINVTPSSLGLRLFALCSGHRGMLQDFYGVNG
jgi:PilZ domain